MRTLIYVIEKLIDFDDDINVSNSESSENTLDDIDRGHNVVKLNNFLDDFYDITKDRVSMPTMFETAIKAFRWGTQIETFNIKSIDGANVLTCGYDDIDEINGVYKNIKRMQNL